MKQLGKLVLQSYQSIASINLAYIGNKAMSTEQKLYDLPSVPEVDYETRLKSPIGETLNLLKTGDDKR